MINQKLILSAASIIVIAAILSSCAVLGMQTNLKPENLKRYKVKGAYVYGSVELPPAVLTEQVMIMFTDAPSLNMNVHKDTEYFLIDVPLKCKGITRIGVRYDDQNVIKEIWYNKGTSFTIESNKINYLGSFVLTNIDGSQWFWDKLIVTNYFEEDRDDFYTNYSALTKYEFYQVEISK